MKSNKSIQTIQTVTFIVCGLLFSANILFATWAISNANNDDYFGSDVEEVK